MKFKIIVYQFLYDNIFKRNMSDGNVIDISGIPKPRLLEELWNHARVAGFFGRNPQIYPLFVPPPQDSKWSFDYYCGRSIKTDISGDTANVCGYDRDSGRGKFAEIVANLRFQLYHETHK
jgi:hypothetical protein